MSLRLWSFFFNHFFLCHSDWILYIDLPSKSLTFLLVFPVCYWDSILVIVFFRSKIPICFFFVSFIYLLRLFTFLLVSRVTVIDHWNNFIPASVKSLSIHPDISSWGSIIWFSFPMQVETFWVLWTPTNFGLFSGNFEDHAMKLWVLSKFHKECYYFCFGR